MRVRCARTLGLAVMSLASPAIAWCQQPLTWSDVQQRFEQNNPALQAGDYNVRESKASEVTAGLRPNPVFSSVNDQLPVFGGLPFQPLNQGQWTQTISELVERRNKRPLRVESAELATQITSSGQEDLHRQLMFALRDAFIGVLRAKELKKLADRNLEDYDKVIAINRQRQAAGDLSRIDLSRIELQRVQLESDLQNAVVGLRTAKIALLALMNDHTPVDSFDVAGSFEYHERVQTPNEIQQAAIDTRPDLRAAVQSIEKAQVDHQLAWANGSVDPIVQLEYQRTQYYNTMGFGVTVPLRIFDRNQGEKARTQLEIDRSRRLEAAARSGILRDVDSSIASLDGLIVLLRAYRGQYLRQAGEVRDTVSFAFMNGGSSLLDFLDAEKSFRDTQVAYINLVGSYLSAVNQLNYSVGKEIMQ